MDLQANAYYTLFGILLFYTVQQVDGGILSGVLWRVSNRTKIVWKVVDGWVDGSWCFCVVASGQLQIVMVIELQLLCSRLYRNYFDYIAIVAPLRLIWILLACMRVLCLNCKGRKNG